MRCDNPDCKTAPPPKADHRGGRGRPGLLRRPGADLQSYGWEVSAEPLATEELLIPKEMDASYDDYLALQSGQGFDLSKYAGKRVKRYTYEITNYPTGETGILANLLIYKNTVIGGEVLSPQLDGFLHGLAMP